MQYHYYTTLQKSRYHRWLQRGVIWWCISVIGLIAVGVHPHPALAQSPTPQSRYERATVLEVLQQTTLPTEPIKYTQQVRVRQLPDGPEHTIAVGTEFQPLTQQQLLKAGTNVIISQQPQADGSSNWVVVDVNRLPVVIGLFALFAVAVIAVGRWQGLFSLMGMGVSFAVLLLYVVPRILDGQNPILVSLSACFAIATVTLYLAHGVSKKTHVALLSLFISLGGVALTALLAVQLASLVGLGSEEAFFLQLGPTANINLQGLLLGGILLGALGVLDDITVAQSAVVFQIAAAKRTISAKELFARAMVVGRDHVASLVNTLVLAYVGANMALFLLFYLDQQTPHWVALNSEMIVEEVIRTLAGSLGLVLAVPLTTSLAVLVAKRWPDEIKMGNKDKKVNATSETIHLH